MILSIIVSGVAFLIGAALLSGFSMRSIPQAFLVAIVVAVLNITLGTFLKIVTLGLLTVGVFNWLLNAVLILIADWFLPGFKVKNFWWALGLAAIVSVVTCVLGRMF